MIEVHQPLWRTSRPLLLISLLAGCNSTPPLAEAPPPPVSVSQPVVRDVIDHDDYEGRIVAVKTVEVRARVRGHLDKVHFKDGQFVTTGTLLFEIDPRTYEAGLEAAEAQRAGADAALELARKEFARTSSLLKSGAASREEVDVWSAKQLTASADRLKALAAVKEAKLDLDFTKIYAPIDGKISSALVTEGNLVNAGGGETLLTTIVSIDPMYVDFDVNERAFLEYRHHFRKDQKPGEPEPSLRDLKIPCFVGLDGEKGFPHEGVLVAADNRVNPSTGTIQVRGQLSNASRILDAGMRARVRVPVSDPRKAILITERAVGTDQGRKFVYVVNDQNVAERRDVQLGRLSEGLQVVQEGLKPGDWIVVNGVQRVRDGEKIEPKKIAMPGAPAEKPTAEAKN